MAKYDVISFLSDMGNSDESVAVCKAIMFQQAPHATIFDITHDVPQFDVRAGALALTRAIQFLPAGIVVAAVDPGSPRNQRYIAFEIETGILIGPDNGILAPAVQLIGEPKRAFEISNPDFRIEAPGAIFAARDILAPAAGVIASGANLKDLGPQIPFDQLVPGMLQLSRHDEGGAFLGEVWSVDRFGNVELNITPEELDSKNVRVGDTVTLRVGTNDFMAKYVETYADLAISQLGILVDSTGMISVVKNLDYAARELDIKEGKAIAILPQGATITGRDVNVEAYSDAGSDSGSGLNQVAQNSQDQSGSTPNPLMPSLESFGDVDQNDPGVFEDQPVPPPIQTTALDSTPTEFSNQQVYSEPTPAPPAPAPAPASSPVDEFSNTQANDPAVEVPQPTQPVPPISEQPSAPVVDPMPQSPTSGKYDKAPYAQSFGNDYVPAPGTVPPTPENSQPSHLDQASALPVQPDYVPAPGPQNPQVHPEPQDDLLAQYTQSAPAPSAPIAPPTVTPPPPVDTSVDSPASYFPTPEVQPPAVAPSAPGVPSSPEPANFGQVGQPPSTTTPVEPQGELPKNVFDLFKEDDDQDGKSSASDQHPQQ